MDLKKTSLKESLPIEKTYKDIHKARDYLLTKENTECVQIKGDCGNACEKLLPEVVKSLVWMYPESFNIKKVYSRMHVCNEITTEEWSLARPFDRHPLEVCARLAIEDLNILVKGEFTQQYYVSFNSLVYGSTRY